MKTHIQDEIIALRAEVARVKTENGTLTDELDVLEKNARVQAKLLADTGRAKEAAEAKTKMTEGEAKDIMMRLFIRFNGDRPPIDTQLHDLESLFDEVWKEWLVVAAVT